MRLASATLPPQGDLCLNDLARSRMVWMVFVLVPTFQLVTPSSHLHTHSVDQHHSSTGLSALSPLHSSRLVSLLSEPVKMAAAASSNPITSAVPSSNPISSVSQSYAPAPIYNNPQLLSRLNLDLRGRVFPVDRETLMLLPESVLLGLFPQGLVLSKPASWEGADDGVFTVDVSHDFFISICYLAQDLRDVNAAAANMGYSSTRIVLNTFSISGQMPKLHFTAPQRLLVDSTPNNPYPSCRTQTSTNPPILWSRNKQSSYFGKNWNTFQSPKLARWQRLI